MKYLIPFLIVILFASCKNERDNIEVCYNGGVYETGGCVCNTGFAGTNCETVLRNKLLGNWFARSSNSPAASQYSINILPNAAAKNSITLRNYLNYLNAVQAFVINDSLINVPAQQLQGKSVMGTGYVLNHSSPEHMMVISCAITDLATGVVSVVVDTLQ